MKKGNSCLQRRLSDPINSTSEIVPFIFLVFEWLPACFFFLTYIFIWLHQVLVSVVGDGIFSCRKWALVP